MDLSIIIVNYNVYNDVIECITSINNNVSKLSYEIIVVDNNSSNRDIENLNKIFPHVKLVLNRINKGFGYANNIGAANAAGDYIVLVNPDIFFPDNSLEKMYEFLVSDPRIGVVGPVQVKPNNGIEYYYTFFPSIYSRLMQEFRLYMTAPVMKQRFYNFLDDNIKLAKPFQVDWVMGSCMMLKRKLFDEAGRFDEAFFLYEEETELEFRIKSAGYRNYMIPEAKVLHNHHSSSGKLGVLFINYQEFRSRIIFDCKRFKGLTYLFRRISISAALITRIIYFSIKSIFNKRSKNKLLANYDLFLFSIKNKSDILNDRYNFDKKLHLFIQQ